MLLLLHPRPRLWNGYRDLTPLLGKLAASLSGFCIISASACADAIGRWRKKARPLSVEDNRGKRRARTVIGVLGVDETPEATAAAIASSLRGGMA